MTPRLNADKVHSAISPSGSSTLLSGLVGRAISRHRLLCLIGATDGSNAPWVLQWSTF